MLTLSSAFPTTSVLPKVCKWDVMTLEKKKYIQRHETNRGKNSQLSFLLSFWIRTEKGSQFLFSFLFSQLQVLDLTPSTYPPLPGPKINLPSSNFIERENTGPIFYYNKGSMIWKVYTLWLNKIISRNFGGGS